MCKLFQRCLLISALLMPVNHSFAQEVNQKAVLIIASHNFRDEELCLPKNALQAAGIEVTLASSTLSPARGMLGQEVKPDILIQDLKVEDFDAIIFVGGSGAKEYWDNSIAHNIAIKAHETGKIVGAICIAPVTLARSGILNGRQATVWPGVADELKSRGVNYTTKAVEIDQNIITADGPEAASEFAQAIISALKGD